MTRKLHVILPDVEHCKAVVGAVREAGIPERNLHVVGNHFTPLEGLQEAGVLERSELTRGVELGLGVGGAAGLLGGLLAVTFPPAGLVLGGGAVLATVLAGAGAGALVSGLVAMDIPNRKLAEYKEAITAGKLLLIMEVPRQRAEEISALVQNHHPEAEIHTSAPQAAASDDASPTPSNGPTTGTEPNQEET